MSNLWRGKRQSKRSRRWKINAMKQPTALDVWLARWTWREWLWYGMALAGWWGLWGWFGLFVLPRVL